MTVATDTGDAYCVACRLDPLIPNLSPPDHVLDRWYRLERNRRRLLYGLIRLGLPLRSQRQDPATGLAFSFLSQRDEPGGAPDMTGHVTINIDEADSSDAGHE